MFDVIGLRYENKTKLVKINLSACCGAGTKVNSIYLG